MKNVNFRLSISNCNNKIFGNLSIVSYSKYNEVTPLRCGLLFIFFMYVLKKKSPFFYNKNYKEKNQKLSIKELIVLNLNFILNSFPTNRDNGYIDKETKAFGTLMENFNYDCTGKEAVIKDCSTNNDSCPISNKFVSRTELTCRSKKHFLNHALHYKNTEKGNILFYQ